jgi:hypothetical protein
VRQVNNPSEFEKFDAIVGKVFSVPHSEIVKREKEYKRKRKRLRERRVNASSASRAANGKD